MNKLIFLVILVIESFSICYGQENLTYLNESTVEQVDSLVCMINQRESSLELLKKDKERVDTLSCLVEDYALLAQIWENKYNGAISSTTSYEPLLVLISESDSVFASELSDISLVPCSLRGHYNSLLRVMTVQKDIDAIENKIEEKTKACIELNQDPLVVIPQLISDDLEALYLAISEIKESGLSTFSKEQQKYFDERIKNKYNSFEKYFTNE